MRLLLGWACILIKWNVSYFINPKHLKVLDHYNYVLSFFEKLATRVGQELFFSGFFHSHTHRDGHIHQ